MQRAKFMEYPFISSLMPFTDWPICQRRTATAPNPHVAGSITITHAVRYAGFHFAFGVRSRARPLPRGKVERGGRGVGRQVRA